MTAQAPTRTAATVAFRHVTKRYDPGARNVPGAVNDLSLTVPAGKICVFVGPSGCGKTTTLKMVNRLIEPTSGEILIDGVDVMTRDVTDLRRGIGYVIQQVGLFPHQTIAENVVTVPRLLGWPKERLRRTGEELLALVGLEPATYRARYPAQLSGGERQRVGVARALAANPPIMLMDEPFGAVDPIVRERLQNEFLRLQEELAKTILFVTHDIDEAIKMGDLVAVMERGGVVAQFGPPEEILASPASDFVARFVGADRGLKRLSLIRVGDLELPRIAVVRPGDPVESARGKAHADPLPYLLMTDDDGKPIGWIRESSIPAAGVLTTEQAIPMSPLLNRRTTLKDALSLLLDADVQVGIVVDRSGAAIGLVTVDMIAERMRETARRRFGAGSPRGGLRVIRWDWIRSNVPQLFDATVDHLVLTGVAVGVGLILSFGAAILIARRRPLAGPITGTAGILYTIPSLALFAFLTPFTGLSFLTAEIGLVSYTLLILIRNILAGLDSVPPEVREAADGMGYGWWRRFVSVELPLALPLIIAGIRIATVTTIGLVMVASVVGQGGLGQVMVRGFNFRNDTAVYTGAVLIVVLAVIADLVLAGIGRRVTPWSRQRAT